jgi:hypothetical protein
VCNTDSLGEQLRLHGAPKTANVNLRLVVGGG